jgi:hypothetical protein
MMFRYATSQGWRLLKSSYLQSVLLIFCYACGILIPLSALSYRQSVIYGREYSRNLAPTADYQIFPTGMTALSRETFAGITDYDEIKSFLQAVGNGAAMSLRSLDMYETAMLLDGHVIRGNMRWQLPADADGYVYDNTLERYLIIGDPLRPCTPYEVMIGDRVLRHIGNPASFIGSSMMIYGNLYTVVGVLNDSSDIVGNLLSRSHALLPLIDIRVTERSNDVRLRLVNELYERFELAGLRELTHQASSGSYYDQQLDRQVRDMLAISVLSFLFCILSSIAIINLFLADNNRRSYIKMTMGAKRGYVFMELAVFWVVIIGTGSLLAFLALFGVRDYLAIYIHQPLLISWRAAMTLPVAGFVTALIASLYSVYVAARRLA